MGSFGILLAPRMAGRVDSRDSVSFVGSQTSGACGRPVRNRLREGRGQPRAFWILASGAAQLAASNRPLPGAETALFLYHRYFSGEIPDRRATKAGLFPPSSGGPARCAKEFLRRQAHQGAAKDSGCVKCAVRRQL